MKKNNTSVKSPVSYSQDDKIRACQLFEKGLLSAQTLLDVHGFDPEQEIKRKKTDACDLPTWVPSENDKKNHLLNKVEQARRNVEIISRVIGTFTEGQEIRAQMQKVLLSSLEIMKETAKL